MEDVARCVPAALDSGLTPARAAALANNYRLSHSPRRDIVSTRARVQRDVLSPCWGNSLVDRGRPSLSHSAAATPPTALGDGVFDVAQLVALCDDNGRTVAGLLGMLVAAGTSALDPLGHDWDRDARAAAAAALHALRGSVGTFGARRFALAVRVLEQALRDNADTAQLDQLLAAVRAEMLATLAAAAAWRSRWEQADAPAAVVVDADQLAQLRQLLEGRNMAAGAFFRTIEAGLPAIVGHPLTGQLRAAIDRLDFAAAVLLLEQAPPGAGACAADLNDLRPRPLQ